MAFPLEAVGDFLATRALPIYVTTLVPFALIELGLARGEMRPASPAGRYVVNFGLPMLGVLLALALPIGSAGAAQLATLRAWGLFNLWDVPWPVILTAGLVTRTLLAYWLHRAMHAWPVLWRIHRVHHTDPVIDVSTGLRHHPLELVIAAPLFLSLVIVLGLPLWAALLVDLAMLAGSFFKHLDGDLPPRAERWLGTVLATPAIHRFHHSARAVETDSNFGNLVSVWDRIFGTFTDPAQRRPDRLGLGERFDHGAHDLWQQLRVGVVDPAVAAENPKDPV